ncbi:MAG: hypothetical protein ACI3W5_13235, partial [Faecousia sp.]
KEIVSVNIHRNLAQNFRVIAVTDYIIHKIYPFCYASPAITLARKSICGEAAHFKCGGWVNCKCVSD